MRPSAPRSCIFPVAILAPFLFALPALAAVEYEYRAKTDETSLYRTIAMEPPPVAVLSGGESVTLLYQGENQSMVKTAGGLRGWVRNSDLVAVKLAAGKQFQLGEQGVQAGRNHISIDILKPRDPIIEVGILDRSFQAEVVETMDREQLEMRNDEN